LGEALVELGEALVHPVEALVHPVEALVDLGEALVHLGEALVHLGEALVHLGEPAREEVDELLMLAGRHGSFSTSGRSVVQVCPHVDTGGYTSARALGLESAA
jgi:hypothetical protein